MTIFAKTLSAAKNSIAATFEKEKVYESGLYDDAELQTALAEQRRIDAMSPRNGPILLAGQRDSHFEPNKDQNHNTIRVKQLEHQLIALNRMSRRTEIQFQMTIPKILSCQSHQNIVL